MLFFAPNITDNYVVLSEEESRHCTKVLRLKIADTIEIIDGIGNFYIGKISIAHDKRCEVQIIETHKNYTQRPHKFHLLIAPTKNNERIEWLLEKACEIGIDEITFVTTQRSERSNIKTERLHKIMVSAIKQSQKALLPTLNEPIKLKDALVKLNTSNYTKLIAHCIDDGKRTALLKSITPNTSYAILIGPEGDFTPDEVQLAIDAGFKPLSLGNYRLRTETAALHACSIFNAVNEY
jgi:16S rRNA (uracil1498-N3)-methyltransferase